MAETALYRKYRPSSFSDVIGQDHIVAALKGAIGEGNVGHAYLLYGSRGTGKTSIARIFAREIGAHDTDIHEIDAASYTSVDNIRSLREEAFVMPFSSPKKVYILDEVHMLSKAAFNAFLKILEEPPAHVVFILATTELESVPDTVQSRCQVFTLKKPTMRAVAQMVERVAKAEGFTLEKASAELIGLLAHGSFRDAHSILQKIIATSPDTTISVAEVEAVTGAPKGALVTNVIRGLAASDAEVGLSAIARAVAENADMELFATLLLDRVRTLLLLRYAPALGAECAADIPEGDAAILTELAKNPASNINSETLRTLIDAAMLVNRSPVPHIPLELAIMELSGQDKVAKTQ